MSEGEIDKVIAQLSANPELLSGLSSGDREALMRALLAGRSFVMSLNKLVHELRVPIVAFRAAQERVEMECKENRYSFQHDHFKEMRTYCDLMDRLMMQLDMVRKGPDRIAIDPVLTRLHADIVAPATRFVAPILVRKRLRRAGIRYSNLLEIPRLYLDPGLMSQVIFNLLDNAIKYSKPDDRAGFKVEIEGSSGEGGYEILCRDYGIGVPDGHEERIFEFGFRGPNAEDFDVGGEGMGLWFALQIVRLHGGTLTLRNNRNPTTFRIVLPYGLSTSPPIKVSSEDES